MTAKIERFNGADLWKTLTAGQKAEIGAIAIELVVASHGVTLSEDRHAFDHIHRALAAAGSKLTADLDHAIMSVLQPGALVDLPVPARLGPVCRQCGCSEMDACGFGCAWADEARTICTECRPHSSRLRRAS